MTKTKKILYIVAALFLSLLILAVASEILLRTLPSDFKLEQERQRYQKTRSILQNEFCEADPNPLKGWRNISGKSGVFENKEFRTHVRFNSLGFRGPEVAPLPPGHKRILVLGDSFTVGWGVEEDETFASLLDRKNGTWQVLNLGVSGYGTQSEWAQLEEVGPRLKPDKVVVAFYQNDLHDNALPRPFSLIPPRPYTGVEIFYAVQFFQGTHLRRLMGLNKKHQPFYKGDPDSERARRSEMYIDKIRAWCGENGAELVFLYIPIRHEIRAKRAFGTRKWINEHMSKVGIPLLDLTPIIRKQPDPWKAYFRLDDHFTPIGHRLTADVLSDFLQN